MLFWRFASQDCNQTILRHGFHSCFSTVAKRRLDVAIVGLPNVGKSQLLNLMTKSIVAAVSRKRHTTREGIMGSRIIKDAECETQLLFVDTPGYLRKEDAKREGVRGTVMNTAKREISDVDFTLIVVDAAAQMTTTVRETMLELIMKAVAAKGRKDSLSTPVENSDESQKEQEKEHATNTLADVDCDTAVVTEAILEPNNNYNKDDDEIRQDHEVQDQDDGSKKIQQDEMDNSMQNFAVVLNKTDLVRPKQLLIKMAMEIFEMAEACIKRHNETVPDRDEEALMESLPTFFYTDCRHNDGIDEIVEFLKRRATPCQEFESDMLAQPEEQAYEIIREKIYRTLHREVPYHVHQVNQLFQPMLDKETGEPGLLISQTLLVQTKSHLNLLKGRSLSAILETAKRDLVKNFQCPVELQLNVKLAKSSERTWSV